MAIAMPVEISRQGQDTPADRGSAVRSVIGQPAGSILLIGDDPLLIRTLDRLLRRAGYSVGTEDRRNDEISPAQPAPTGAGVALTIVDLPDHHVLDSTGPNPTAGGESTEVRFLWIGSTPPSVQSAWFLAKPFTTEEFLSRVESLLAIQN